MTIVGVYGSRLGDSVVDEDTFGIVSALVLCHPGTTEHLPDVVEFNVPASAIQRPGALSHPKFAFQVDAHGRSVACRAVSNRSMRALFEIREPAPHLAFDHVSVFHQTVHVNAHLLRREQSAFSCVSVLTDRVVHTVRAHDRDVTFTMHKRWVYPFQRQNSEDGISYFRHAVHEISFETGDDVPTSVLKSIIIFNLPSYCSMSTVFVAKQDDSSRDVGRL